MTYLLDTNTCIQFINPRDTNVRRKLSAVAREEVFICQMVKAELLYGAYKSARREANLALLVKFLVSSYRCYLMMLRPKSMAAYALN